MLIYIVTAVFVLVAVGGFLQVRALRRKLTASALEVSELEYRLTAARRMADEFSSKMEAILSASEDAILLADSTGACYLLNDQARTYFGDLPSHQTILAATQSAELDTLLKQAHRTRAGEEPTAGEIVLRAFGDRAMQVLITRVGPVGCESPDDFLILLRDITDLRRLETVRRDFVANVSHELRTPLSSVKAMAETLLDGALDDPGVARPFLETIIDETDRLVRLSADLLDLSRIEMRPVVKEDSDLATMIDDVVGRLDNQRSKAGLTLTLEIERPLIAPCDAYEVAQVLVNLLDNAIKYTPRGGSVDISAHLRKGRIVVEVSDTGIGILQQDIPRLFERFYRTDKARSRQSGGTGLGLSIVKHIVERHGGELWVRSEYNRGSTFGFSVPRPREISGLTARLEGLQFDWDANKRGEYVVVGATNAADSTNAGTSAVGSG
jgi:two-component system, OmpR family, phosphate regulon sensor histidine kinase PhoR